MNLLFVFTGGTIGSVEKNGVADVDGSTAEEIAKLCRKDGDTLEFACPYNILSENATERTLSDILNYMLSVDYGRYDGVIVTHGSDTAAFTANMLGHVLSRVVIPVVITAANYVMTDPRSNARDNLNAAYTFIRDSHRCNCCAHGVFFSWTNAGEHPKIHVGSRLLEPDQNDRFDSFGEIYGQVVDNHFYRHGNSEPTVGAEFSKGSRIALRNNVLLLRSFVGLDYRDIYIKGKAAVLLKLYHSGTACMGESEDDSHSFLYLAKMCKNEGVDLYIATAKQGSYIYSSEQGFKGTGAIPLYGMSDISAYTLLLLAYGTGDECFKNALKNSRNFN